MSRMEQKGARKQWPALVAALVFFLPGLAMVTFSSLLVVEQITVALFWESTTGVVTKVEKTERWRKLSRYETEWPTVEFLTKDGKSVSVTPRQQLSEFFRYENGQKVQVSYKKSDPSEFQIEAGLVNWYLAFLFIPFGGLLVYVSVRIFREDFLKGGRASNHSLQGRRP